MTRFARLLMVPAAALAIGLATSCALARDRGPTALPAPASDLPRAAKPSKETVVFAGGCFWGIQAVFQHVNGVIDATSGYSGGDGKTAQYELVSTGDTGHAESVRVTYDPSKVTYGQLLQVFFSVAHDPTQLNRQGPDEGTQYRSVVFYATPDQKRVTDAYIAQLTQAKAFPTRIVTQVVPLQAFYPAEAYHQNYAARHPHDPYIAFNDAPKVDHLHDLFPSLYRTP
ncbi:MAG TPA: peptide-methionine (S)-S-oxide reductase MsrA [Polyangia bacterium]|nr:peptide-methionine (S)-S-oxide reductase MsrA [Polyangia bacterium]